MPIGDKVTHLLLALQTKTLNEEARQMAAVVLRRLFSSSFNEFYPNVSEHATRSAHTRVLTYPIPLH